MARRDALRELSRRFPAPSDVNDIILSLHKQNDRSIAIVSVAVLESLLERLLIKKLNEPSPELEGRLFKNRGPISDFDSKILIAMALGLLTEGQSKALNSIRAVRNVFAHSTGEVNFSTQEIDSEIQTSLASLAVKLIAAATDDELSSVDSKRAFIVVARIMCWQLDQTYKDVTGAPLLDLF